MFYCYLIPTCAHRNHSTWERTEVGDDIIIKANVPSDSVHFAAKPLMVGKNGCAALEITGTRNQNPERI